MIDNKLFDDELVDEDLIDDILTDDDELSNDELINDELINDELFNDKLFDDELFDDELIEDELIDDKLFDDELSSNGLIDDEFIDRELINGDELTVDGNQPESVKAVRSSLTILLAVCSLMLYSSANSFAIFLRLFVGFCLIMAWTAFTISGVLHGLGLPILGRLPISPVSL